MIHPNVEPNGAVPPQVHSSALPESDDERVCADTRVLVAILELEHYITERPRGIIGYDVELGTRRLAVVYAIRIAERSRSLGER